MYLNISYSLLIVLDLALLQPLIHASLNLLAKSVHLIRLLLNQSGFSSDYLLVALIHVSLPFLVLHLLRLNLDLVRLGVLLLAGKLALDSLQVQKFSAQLEGQGKLLLEHLSILFKIANVSLLESADRLLILRLDLREGLVPALVEILVLHQMGLLDLFALARLVVD
jgi:hypothetical protein